MAATLQAQSDFTHVIDARPVGALQTRVIILCALVVLLDGYDIQTLAITVPVLTGQWHLPATSFTLALTASLIGYAIGAAAVAGVGDLVGRRPVLIIATAVMGVASIATAFSTDVTQLELWRFLTGVGFGASVPNATAMTSEFVPTARRAALITLMYANIALGAVIAGFSAPWILRTYDWHVIFLVGGVGPLMISVLLLLGVPESVRFLMEKRPGDLRIAATLRKLFPDLDPASIGLGARTTVHHQSVVTLLDATYRPRTILLWTAFALNLFALYFLISWLPTLLRSSGWSAADASRGGVMLQIGGIVFGLYMAWLIDRGHTVAAMVGAYIISAVSFGLFLVLPSTSGVWWLLLLTIGAGTSGTQFALNALSAAFYPPIIRSTGVGWAVGVGRVGAIIGPLVGGLIGREHLATPAVMGLLVIPVLACAVCVSILPRVWRG